MPYACGDGPSAPWKPGRNRAAVSGHCSDGCTSHPWTSQAPKSRTRPEAWTGPGRIALEQPAEARLTDDFRRRVLQSLLVRDEPKTAKAFTGWTWLANLEVRLLPGLRICLDPGDRYEPIAFSRRRVRSTTVATRCSWGPGLVGSHVAVSRIREPLDAPDTVSDRLGIVAAAGNYQSQRSRNSAQMNPW